MPCHKKCDRTTTKIPPTIRLFIMFGEIIGNLFGFYADLCLCASLSYHCKNGSIKAKRNQKNKTKIHVHAFALKPDRYPSENFNLDFCFCLWPFRLEFQLLGCFRLDSIKLFVSIHYLRNSISKHDNTIKTLLRMFFFSFLQRFFNANRIFFGKGRGEHNIEIIEIESTKLNQSLDI